MQPCFALPKGISPVEVVRSYIIAMYYWEKYADDRLSSRRSGGIEEEVKLGGSVGKDSPH